MSTDDAVVLVLRVAVIALLYLFLFAVALITRNQLSARAVARGSASSLLVLDSGDTALRPGSNIALEPITHFGRSSENTIVVDDTFVSAVHAVVQERAGSWWVHDEGSTNGTFVNGKLVDGDVRLRAGDELQIGHARFRLVVARDTR